MIFVFSFLRRATERETRSELHLPLLLYQQTTEDVKVYYWPRLLLLPYALYGLLTVLSRRPGHQTSS